MLSNSHQVVEYLIESVHKFKKDFIILCSFKLIVNAMSSKASITRDISIEELINNYSFSICYLRDKGICCIPCGDPIQGTFEEAARLKNFDENAITGFVEEMKHFAEEGEFVSLAKKD